MTARLARILAWLTAPAFVGGMAASVWLQPRATETDLTDVYLFVGFGAFALVGGLLLARRPDHPVSWILAAAGLLLVVSVPAEAWAAYQVSTSGRPDALGIFGLWMNAWYWYVILALLFAVLPLVFPDGCLPSRRWRPIAWASGIAIVGSIAIGGLSENLEGQTFDYVVRNPIGIEGSASVEQHPLFPVVGGLLFLGALGGVASVVSRFRKSSGVERLQLKWFLTALVLFPIGIAFESVPIVVDVAFALALIGLPTAIGIAILRYRLFEIDRIISRTATYAMLTAVLAGVYVLIAVVPAAVFELDSDLLVAAATLAAAAAFVPIRRRVQRWVDRRFNRARYDAQQVADAFSLRLRDQVELQRLIADIRGVLGKTVQPANVSLWLKDGS